MDSKVVYKCTVYDSRGKELFQLEGVDEAVLADAACRKAHKEYSRNSLYALMWQFEKVYPKSAAAQFQPPNMDDRLEAYGKSISTIANASNQV